MAKVDYYGLKEEVRTIIEQGLGDGTAVYSEEAMQFAPEMSPWICVYLSGREVPDDQPIAAGRVTRFRVRFSVWVWTYSFEQKEAEQQRDEYIGKVELILMSNRTLNDLVDGVLLEGGDLPSRKDDDDFTSAGGEIKFVADIRAEV